MEEVFKYKLMEVNGKKVMKKIKGKVYSKYEENIVRIKAFSKLQKNASKLSKKMLREIFSSMLPTFRKKKTFGDT